MCDKPGNGYVVVDPDQVADRYSDSDELLGDFRPVTNALRCEQLAAALIRVAAHSGFEQGTGHFNGELEELYLLTRGTLTMRFGDHVRKVSAPAAVRVAKCTPHSYRNEDDEPVELWAVSRKLDGPDSPGLDADFWEASPEPWAA